MYTTRRSSSHPVTAQRRNQARTGTRGRDIGVSGPLHQRAPENGSEGPSGPDFKHGSHGVRGGLRLAGEADFAEDLIQTVGVLVDWYGWSPRRILQAARRAVKEAPRETPEGRP